MTAIGEAPEGDASEGPAVRRSPAAQLSVDAALAVLGAFAALAVSAISGFPKLTQPGTDNDSVMRLVQVRDLIAGQGWFDLMQYRMGTEGGLAMHWSRLVDAPLAGLILLLRPLFGAQGAEMLAAIFWPTVLMAAALFFLLRAARAVGGEAARFPALVLGGTAMHFTGIFTPGSFDHHNLQVALVLAATAWLAAGSGFAQRVAAGVAVAASMAIGMETMPYVAAAGVAAALLFWHDEEAPAAAGYGTGLAGGAAICLALTVRPDTWSVTHCDAFSGGQAGSAVLAGLGLVAVATVTGRKGTTARFVGLAALAGASVAFLMAAYPECLADPYAGVSSRLRDYWLEWVTEAQSLITLLAASPAEAATYYITPLIGLLLLAIMLARSPGRRELLPVALLLAAAYAVSIWQVRGALFSLPLAVIPLAGWVGQLRSRAAAVRSSRASLRLAAAWLISFNIAWGMAALLALGQSKDTDVQQADACRGPEAFGQLAELPAGTVLALSNHGPMILAESPHRALAGPYHRNGPGNLAVIDAMTGSPGEALGIVRHHRIDYVALCPGNPETQVLTDRAPSGLAARIQRSEPIEWLQPLSDTETAAFRVFRVSSPASLEAE